ncbi:MAG TPA: flavin reductase family protein [Tepidisphaeraceae bacterium]|jgi:flavin reductase (DIM6/NTAB) family NADH-FMN oxidoreductase RutF
MHKTIEPSILYFGTPVVLVSTISAAGATNLTPLSSAWALGWTLVLGFEETTKGIANLKQTHQCVVNVPSPDLWQHVERLAPLTGNDPVPPHKASKFRYCSDKFAAAGLTPVPAECVKPPRVLECPIQFEAQLENVHPLADPGKHYPVALAAVEVRVLRVHVDEKLIKGDHHIDPARWSPLIYNFRHYFGLGAELGKTFRAEV